MRYVHLVLGAALVVVTGPIVATAAPSGVNAFGTRDPRPCPSVTGGRIISTAQAAALAACSREQQSRRYSETLVDKVRVVAITASRYDPYTQTGSRTWIRAFRRMRSAEASSHGRVTNKTAPA